MKKLPTLPRGEGSFFEHRDKIGYRKNITLPTGKRVKKTVYADTVSECMAKMKEQEYLIEKNILLSKDPLYVALYKWLETYKKPTLKQQSYERLERTIKNIENSSLGRMQYQSITTDNIQHYLNMLNDMNYSYSTIDKYYHVLNGFYKYISAKDNIKNPMVFVVKPKKNIINKNTKEIQWFDNEDIKKFINECKRKSVSSGKYKHYNGLVYAANIFLGLRIGELLALQWKDINFEKKYIHVYKTMTQFRNPEYNSKIKGSKKYIMTVQNSTKTSFERIVPMSSHAEELLLEYKKTFDYTNSNDYLISTRNKNTVDVKSVNDCLKRIQEKAGTKVQNAASHTLRHTCASLLFRSGTPVEVIAKILGHSPEVCRNIYIGFAQEQLQNAIDKIDIHINLD